MVIILEKQDLSRIAGVYLSEMGVNTEGKEVVVKVKGGRKGNPGRVLIDLLDGKPEGKEQHEEAEQEERTGEQLELFQANTSYSDGLLSDDEGDTLFTP